MSSEFNEKNYSSKMDKSIQSLKKDLSTLRTGRANPNMLDTIKIDVYGQIMPIDQLATISVPEARLISIQVWDKTNVVLIDPVLYPPVLPIIPKPILPYTTMVGNPDNHDPLIPSGNCQSQPSPPIPPPTVVIKVESLESKLEIES